MFGTKCKRLIDNFVKLKGCIFGWSEYVLSQKFIVKLREREGQGVDPGRSLKGHLWMVDGGWWYTFP